MLKIEISPDSEKNSLPAPLKPFAKGVIQREAPLFVKPMAASLVDKAFNREGWFFEVKWDGYRAIAHIKSNNVKLYSRNNISFKELFSSVMDSLRKLPGEIILDGEIVALDKNGKSAFQLLQNYVRTGEGKLMYYVFDIVYYNGYDLTSLPLRSRKEILKTIVPPLPVVRISDHIESEGISFFGAASNSGIEGIIAKDPESPYRSGVRSREWLKIKALLSEEVLICGFTKPKGIRPYFGALILGRYQKEKLIFKGLVGTGFDEEMLADLYNKLAPLVISTPHFELPARIYSEPVWVKPLLVGEVKFTEWTEEGYMREPVFLGLRFDKDPAEVVELEADKIEREVPIVDSRGQQGTQEKVIAKEAVITVQGKQLKLTNLGKVYWPQEGYTKGDLLAYYKSISSVLLKYLKDRPQSLHRFPDGIAGKSFYHKDAGDIAPQWMETFLSAAESEGPIRYLLCQDEASLLYIVNLGCIEINPGNSRQHSINYPDYIVFDLDPVEIPFDAVIEAAQAMHFFLDSIGAPNFCKTSGATGLHIYVPAAARYSYEQVVEFARLVSIFVTRNLPETTSIERMPYKREGKVYIDYLQNRRAQTMVAPYSVRPRPGAPISTPLVWDEVKKGLDPRDFTIKNIISRLKEKGDVWEGILGKGIDMTECLNRFPSRR